MNTIKVTKLFAANIISLYFCAKGEKIVRYLDLRILVCLHAVYALYSCLMAVVSRAFH